MAVILVCPKCKAENKISPSEINYDNTFLCVKCKKEMRLSRPRKRKTDNF